MTSILIGIPTLNGVDRLQRVLESIERHTPMDRYGIKVLVCDDGSTPENLERHKQIIDQAKTLRERCGLEMWMNVTRRGIAASWNTLVRFGGPGWIPEVCVLTNDDVEVVDDWLDPLVYSVTQNPHAGMVGLNAYYGLTKATIARHTPASDVPDHIRNPRIDFHESRMTGGGTLLSAQGYAFAFRRAAFDRVGGFDERYRCFYEELDFGVAMRRAGLFHYTLSYPLIFHMGGATTSDPANMNASEDMQRSRDAFHGKWGKSITDLRRELRAIPPPSFEWNTQLRNWT